MAAGLVRAESTSRGRDGRRLGLKSAVPKQMHRQTTRITEGASTRDPSSGTAVCAGPRSIPVDEELYAVVDLFFGRSEEGFQLSLSLSHLPSCSKFE